VRHKLQHQGRPQILRGDGGVRFTLPASDSLEFDEANEAVPEALATELGGWMKDDAQGPIRKAYTAAGLEPLTFHELRHTYASALINRGVPLVFVAQQLGHADTRMVEEHYGHLCETAKRDAIRQSAPRIFSSPAVAENGEGPLAQAPESHNLKSHPRLSYPGETPRRRSE
jgi:hypothetical protein